MRIAEHFMQKNPNLNNPAFLVGNIGPDCGVPNDDWTLFIPDTKITHWWSSDGAYIDTEDFKERYLTNPDVRYPFYWGYYFHLLADIEWSKLYEVKKIEPVYADGLKADKDFIWIIKKDWYGQDHLFLQRNPDFIFYSMFSKIHDFDNTYFDVYPKNAFIDRVRYITDFYLSANENPDREFPFLSKAEMDDFVKNTICVIEDVTRSKRIIHEQLEFKHARDNG